MFPLSGNGHSLVRDCSRMEFCKLLSGLVSVCSFSLFMLQFFSVALSFFDWLINLFSCVFTLFDLFCDSLTKMLHATYFDYNLACPSRIFITCCSLHTFSVEAPSTGRLLRKSVSFRLLPAIFCIAMSKCASRPKQLVNLALYCLLHQFPSISGSRA